MFDSLLHQPKQQKEKFQISYPSEKKIETSQNTQDLSSHSKIFPSAVTKCEGRLYKTEGQICSAELEIGKTWPCQQLKATVFLREHINFLNVLQQGGKTKSQQRQNLPPTLRKEENPDVRSIHSHGRQIWDITHWVVPVIYVKSNIPSLSSLQVCSRLLQ